MNNEGNWHMLLDDCYIALDAININPLHDNIHNNRKFTMAQHNFPLPFPDIRINKDIDTNNIWMDMFYEKADTRRCVPFSSCDSKQWKNDRNFTFAGQFFTIAENSKARKRLYILRISSKFNSEKDSKINKYLH